MRAIPVGGSECSDLSGVQEKGYTTGKTSRTRNSLSFWKGVRNLRSPLLLKRRAFILKVQTNGHHRIHWKSKESWDWGFDIHKKKQKRRDLRQYNSYPRKILPHTHLPRALPPQWETYRTSLHPFKSPSNAFQCILKGSLQPQGTTRMHHWG